MDLAEVGMVRRKSSAVHYRLRVEGAGLRVQSRTLHLTSLLRKVGCQKTVVSAVYSHTGFRL